MLRSKLKITDLKTHQEYLLLVTKMNLKGVLVESTHTLSKGSKLRLSLQLDDGQPALNLKGIVHKVAQRPDGSRAMIISFIDPDPESQKRIRKALGRSDEDEAESSASIGLSSERTMMVDEDTLSKLTVPKKKEPVSEDSMEELMPSTMDEESVQAANPGLAGSTRIISSDLKQSKARKKSSGRFMKVFVWICMIGVLALAFLIFSEPLLQWLQDKPTQRTPEIGTIDKTIEQARPKLGTPIPTPNPIVDTPKNTPTPKATPTPNPIVKATPTPKPKPVEKKAPPRPAQGQIQSIKVDHQTAFIKVTLEGKGDFSRYETSKAMSPKRLVIDLLRIRNLKVAGTTAVAKNPILRVRAAKNDKGVRVTLDLYPVTFPRFEIKTYSNSLEIFVFR